MPSGLSIGRSTDRMETAVGVLLRTPGLFVIDYFWWFIKNKRHSEATTSSYVTEIIAYFALVNGFLLLLLPISLLRSFYSHFVCGALILSAHLLSCYFVHPDQVPNTELLPIPGSSIAAAEEAAEKIVGEVISDSVIGKLMSLLMIHTVIALAVSSLMRGPQKPVLPVLACYSFPVLARLAHAPADSIQILHNLCVVVLGLSLFRYFVYNSAPSLFYSLKGAYGAAVTSMSSIQGLAELIVSLIGKIFVPVHFLTYWIIAFAIKLRHVSQTSEQSSQTFNEKNIAGTWYLNVLTASAAVCNSPVSLLATTVTVAYVSNFFLSGIKIYLNGFGSRRMRHENEPLYVADDHRANQVRQRELHTGWEEGITTLFLSVLTGITELKQESRMAVLTIILFVLLSSLLQSMLAIAEPVVLSLSAHHGKNVWHHLKVLLLCAFLFLFPLHVTHVLTMIFPVDFWMAVVLSTSLLTSAQVLDLMIVHCLLWFDATRNEPWYALDEVVYYVRAVTKVIEFLVAFSVVIVGVYEGVVGHFSWTNALILLMHCYFNVCKRFQSGLQSFLQRRRSVKKSACLPAATMHQLQSHADVCAICFMDLLTESTSVVTPCSHFFHRVCLRRWLSFHDRCPLCAASVISEPRAKEQKPNEGHTEPVNTASQPADLTQSSTPHSSRGQ